MDAARLASMPEWGVSFDTETHRSQPGLAAPPLVCASIGRRDGGRTAGQLLDRGQAREAFELLLRDDRFVICTANGPYDMVVMAHDAACRGFDLLPLIHGAYRAGRVFDILTAEALNAVADGTLGRDPRTGAPIVNPETGRQGSYSLAYVSEVVLGRGGAKAAGRFRFSYALLEDVPIPQWPADAAAYPVDDAVNTLDCALAQAGHLPRAVGHEWGADACLRCRAPLTFGDGPPCPPRARAHRNLHVLAEVGYKAFNLHRAGSWGLRSDPVAVAELESAALEGIAEGLVQFQDAGFVRDDGSEHQSVVKRATAAAYGATGSCATCGGAGEVHNKFSKRDPSRPVGKKVQCRDCGATGLDLSTAPVPMTEPSKTAPKGNVQIGRDILVESGDELLRAYAEWQEDDKIPSTYAPFLHEAALVPATLRSNAVLESLRVSYWGVVQLLPRQVSARLSARLRARGSRVVGVRDCFRARPGKVYYSVDYTGGELVTFAESAVRRVGFSKMGELLNAGIDVHSFIGARMLGLTYEDFYHRLKKLKDRQCKAFRQAAKPVDFGVPGSMGAVRIVLNQRQQGPDTPHPSGPSTVWDGSAFVPGYKGLRFCVLIGGAERCGAVKITEYKERPYPPVCRACVECAEKLRHQAFQTFTELDPYLRWHGDNAERAGWVEHYMNGFLRGGVDYGSGANNDFQMGLAIIAGRAQNRVSYEQDCDRSSPLYGSRSIVFAHDELLGECDEERGHEVCERVEEVMVEEFVRGCPNHAAACRAEPTLMVNWFKAAEPRYNEAGRLIPWTP